MIFMNRALHEFAPAPSLRPAIGIDDESARTSRRGGWSAREILALVAGWTVVGICLAIPDMIDGFKWSETVGKLVEAWSWALLTPLILRIDRKLSAANPSFLRLAIAHLLLSVPFSIVHTYLASIILYPIPQIWWNPIRSTEFAIYFYLVGWVTYAAFVGALQGFKFHNSFLVSQIALERAEKSLAESRLNALRLQLEPHFLFNTLHAISSELYENPQLAREMIEDLGALLRRSLDCQDRMEITLAQELALLDHYIAIQKLRFGERIEIQVKADPAALPALVPSMFLQPLVENAVRHGLESRLSGGKIVVSAKLIGNQLHVRVLDDGVGLPHAWRMEACTGLGVRVTRERLQTLYAEPGGHDFIISRRRSGGTEVAIRIPLHGAGSEVRGAAS